MAEARRSVFMTGTGLSRRRFLKTLGVGMALGLLGDLRAIAQIQTPTTVDFDMIPGLCPKVTSNEEFYWVEKNIRAHRTRLDRWSLKVEGLVEKKLKFDLEQLRALPAIEEFNTLECISNEVGGDLISNAKWKGVRMVDLLEMAGVKDSAFDVAMFADDGYSDSFTVQKAMEPWVIVAYEMNGEPLPTNHGAPARVIVPGIYGMKNVKYLTRIELVDRDFFGFWERRGWDDLAVVKTTAIIDAPNRDFRLNRGQEVFITGIAYTGDRGISAVEVSVDDGDSWNPAVLEDPLAVNTWRRWAYLWRPEASGRHILMARATDGQGTLQIEKQARPFPSGASGYHTVRVDVR
ncbi:MAG: molybdopterin-dependent oxidoreductase [Candidatus Bipolaricaulia bacterium]